MKIAIIGIGAMGSLFAARLSTTVEVVMVGNWPEQLEALKKGLTLIHADGKMLKRKVTATHRIENVGVVDGVFVLVKSYQTHRAAQQAKQLLTAESTLNKCLTLQNGAGNLEKLGAILGMDRVFAGTTHQAAKLIQPGVVRDTGSGNIFLGEPTQQDKKITKLHNIFSNAGFTVQYSKDIQSLIWGKLVVNAGINPLTAILNQSNGEIGADATTRKIMFQLAHEAAEVATAQNIKLPYKDVKKQVLDVSRATYNNTSSMLQDVLRHSRTEIDAICGEVIEKGKAYNIPTPVNTKIFKMVKEIEEGHRVPDPKTNLSEITQHIIPFTL